MDPDTLFVLGLGLCVLSIPAVVSAFAKGDPPRLAAVVLVFAGALVVWAISNKPGGYPINEIPQVVVKVVRSFT